MEPNWSKTVRYSAPAGNYNLVVVSWQGQWMWVAESVSELHEDVYSRILGRGEDKTGLFQTVYSAQMDIKAWLDQYIASEQEKEALVTYLDQAAESYNPVPPGTDLSRPGAMAYPANTKQWQSGDLVIHRFDDKKPYMLMRVIGYHHTSGECVTVYVRDQAAKAMPKKWQNPIADLLNPVDFGIDIEPYKRQSA